MKKNKRLILSILVFTFWFILMVTFSVLTVVDNKNSILNSQEPNLEYFEEDLEDYYKLDVDVIDVDRLDTDICIVDYKWVRGNVYDNK